MIVLLLELCRAVSVSEIATPNKGITDPVKFSGLSSLYLFGDFGDDLDHTNYQVELDGKECQILSLEKEEIECLIPAWDSNDESKPDLQLLHNSEKIYSKTSAFSWYLAHLMMRLIPNEGAAGDIIGLYSITWPAKRHEINYLKIEGIEVAFEDQVVGNSRPVVLNAKVSNNVHGDQTVEYKIFDQIRPLHWVGGYTLEGDQYWFRTLAAIKSVSFSLEHGVEATITGNSFLSDSSRIRIETDGLQCQVTEATFSTIKCNSEVYFDLANAKYYEGGAGLVRETYTPGNIRVESKLVQKAVISSATILTTMDDYDSVIYGLFKAPRTGNYVFYTSFRGSVRVYLSTDYSPLNKQEIINSSQESDEHSYFVWGENESSSITLTAGESYYLEVEHFSSGERNSFHLGIEMPGNGQRNGFPMIKRLDLNLNDLDQEYSFIYKQQNKRISFSSTECASNNYIYQHLISRRYFNLYVYCHNNYLYALLPSYMNPNPSDLKFKLNDGTEVEGETLREASTDSQFWFVIPSDFLRTYETKPQLRVWIDDRLIMCTGDCQASLSCSKNCLACNSPSEFSCVECRTGYYLLQGVCSSVCPTGYFCSSTSSQILDTSLVFHLQLNKALQNIVTDSASSIPVLTGTNNQFYPFFHKTDPYPTKDRGYYFRGTSLMQLPPYNNVSEPLLVLAPEFTVIMWIRSVSSFGTLLSKQHSDHANILKIGLSDYSLYVEMNQTSQSQSKLNNYWSLVTVKSFLDNGEFRLQAYYNSTQVLSRNLEDWLVDSESNFYFSIGSEHSFTSFHEFFTGFIWEVRIHNSRIQLGDLFQDSNCKGCDFCPLDNLDKCLILCTIDQFWDGEQCIECPSSCYFGCLNNSTCSLCSNDLCTNCNFEQCTSCAENAKLNSQRTCECLQGYSSKYGFCERQFFSAQLKNEDNQLVLEFSESLESELSKHDFKITLQNATIKFRYEVEMTSGREYNITMDFEDYVPKGEIALLEFKGDISSQSNYLLANETLRTELEEYDPSISVTEESRTRTQQAVLAATATSSISLFTSNPSDFWRVMNTLEMLSYIPSTNNQLTPTLAGFFEGLNMLDSIPVGVDYLIQLVTGKSSYFTRYLAGDSKLFLLNAGVSILIIGILLLLWPLVWVVSKIPYCKTPFSKLLAEYKFNVFTRYWMQCYLDLSIAGFVQLVSVPNIEVVGVFNYTSACLVVVLLGVTPGALFLFVKRNREDIVNEDPEFYQKWRTLLYEFDCTDNPETSFFYFVFTLKRVVFAASVGTLGAYPYFQASLNLVCMLGFFGFVLAIRPYLKNSVLALSILAELVTSLVFILVVYFLQNNWRLIDTLVEQLIIWLVGGITAVQSLAPLFSLFAKCCSKKTNPVTRVAVLDGNSQGQVNETRGQVTTTMFSPETQFRKE